jgi:hypothetical protein
MPEVAVVFPIIPGKREAVKTFADTLLNERRADFNRLQSGIERESWFIQTTPAGDVLMVHLEGKDIWRFRRSLLSAGFASRCWISPE